MVNEADTNRPYAPPSNVTALLARLRSRNLPERIDADYLRDAGISEGTVSRALFAMRFLGLIEEDGTPTQALRTINSATDEEYQATLAGLIRNVYGDVFNVIDPAEDSQDRILNVFRRYTPASQRARQVMLFLGLCREAGIPTLDAPRQRGMADRRPTASGRPRASSRRESGDTSVRQQVRRSSGMNPALEGLIGALPPEGSQMTQARRTQWLQMAEATLTFVYGEAASGANSDDGDEGGGASN